MEVTSKYFDKFVSQEGMSFDLELRSFGSFGEGETVQRYVTPLLADFSFSDCSPPTPVSELNTYTQNIDRHHQNIRQAVNAIPPRGLRMGQFAQAVNALAAYVNTMPSQFCIGSSNRSAFEAMQSSYSSALATVRQGNSIFESSLQSFVGQATPLLNRIYNESGSINQGSRDFTGVMNAVRQYQTFANQYDLNDIWNLTQTIANLLNQFKQALQSADSALGRAVAQIETNVEFEAQRFVDQQKLAEAAFRHWDTVDGKAGYERFIEIMRRISQVMIPDFNNFLRKVPDTQRVRNAVNRAQQSINQIDTGFASFPNFSPLPADSGAFPHNRYGNDDRKYGGAAVISALQTIANSYYSRTSRKLYIGDMQYQHGGKMGIHKSHKNGIDADVDGVEIGDVPNHDPAKALALAKETLSAGSALVFYADQATVTNANNWASQNGANGRLQLEANHTGHFHIRLPS